MAEAVLASDPRIAGGDGGPPQTGAAAGRRHRHRRGAASPASGDRLGPRDRRSVRAFLGLGSNLGDRWAHLRRAVDQLRAGSRAPVTAVSRVYETEPVGGPRQGPYLNVVVELALAPAADPYRLLEECRRLEAAAGRVRAARWGPRTLDADVLWMDGLALDGPELTVPHPRWRERRFVLAPLAELAPDLVDPRPSAAAGGEVGSWVHCELHAPGFSDANGTLRGLERRKGSRDHIPYHRARAGPAGR